MKYLAEFSLYEHLTLSSMAFYFKELRNDFVSGIYNKIPATNEAAFIESCKKYKKILIVVAFEKPQVLDYLFKMSQHNLNTDFDYQMIVFDNSKNKNDDILNVCQKYAIPYLSLPYNYTSHPNRSHGMAMSWVYDRIIKQCKPTHFGYLDHDMFPIRNCNLTAILEKQKLYGNINGNKPPYWNLWAGYCFYNFENCENRPMNFLYDFSRGLDTGGRNWDGLYKFYAKDSLTYASDERHEVCLKNGMKGTVQIIDNVWLHIGGVSYSNFDANFITSLCNELLEGRAFNDLLTKSPSQ